MKTLTSSSTFFTVLFCFANTATAQVNHVVKLSTTPVISQVQLAEWQRIVETQQGVTGIDPVGHKIGPNVAKRTSLGLNWYPFDIYKQTLCGTLHHFNFYDGYGDEGDWNHFIIPAPSHSYLLEDAKPIANADDLHQCNAPGDCMEAEITPDEDFYENRWFPKSAGKSDLEGRAICTYGPWVWEEAHGNRPEIHPSELYWWKESEPALETYTLMVIQDDSNRFDRPGNYSGTIVRPWSKFPRSAEFKIPFELSLSQLTPVLEQLIFEIDELSRRNVVTANDATARRDSDDGKEHAIQLDGQIVVRANELQHLDDSIGVRFVELTKGTRSGGAGEPVSNVLRGYIAINSKIGIDDNGKEGYHVIRVRARKATIQNPVAPLAAATPESFPPSLVIKPLPKSLRFAVVDGEPRLAGDVEVRTPLGEVGTRSGVGGLGGNETEVQIGSGAVKFTLPSIALAPIVKMPKREITREALSSWPDMVKAMGGRPETQAPTTRSSVKRADQIRIDVAAFYAPIRDGKPSREDDSPFIEELNEALEKRDPIRTRQLFGSNQPIEQLNWKFSAKNMSTGDAIPVRVGESSPNEITAKILPGLEPDTAAIINFPPELAQSVIEVTATIEIIDAFKNKGVVSKTIWSHSISNVNIGSLVDESVSVSAAIAGAEVSRLVDASKITGLPANDVTVKQPFTRCARTVRLYANRAAEDQNIDMGELTNLKSLVNRCKSLI